MAIVSRLRSALAALSGPDWVANVLALAALVASVYSIKVSRDLAREQIEREQTEKAMQYTIAVRYEVPYEPRFLERLAPDLPERPPYLVVPARLFFTNASSLPQALSGVMFSYDGNAYYRVLGVHETSGKRFDWPLNITPGASAAFDIEVPLPIASNQAAAIRNKLKTLKSPVRYWRDFEDNVLRETKVGADALLFVLPRRTHFWIETLSPSPGFPRRIVFSEWLPPNWRQGRESPPSNTQYMDSSRKSATKR
jgi:hypothetical protein